MIDMEKHEILFRGRRIEDSEWIYGKSIFNEDDYFEIFEKKEILFAGKKLNGIWNIVDKETVCEYTGLKDSFGNRIFEGDILRIHWIVEGREPVYEFAKVSFEKGEYRLIWINSKTIKSVYGTLSFHNNRSKIIGNIFENPEFLEGTL